MNENFLKEQWIARLKVITGLMLIILTICTTGANGQNIKALVDELNKLPCCDYKEVPGVIWVGNDPIMTFQQLASYCAPIMWFSPDEPLLNDATGKDIRIPESFPFEDTSENPVVYFRVRTILTREGATETAYTPDQYDRSHNVIDLSQIVGIDLDYFFYYSSEEGLGGHVHDVESAEFKIGVWKRDKCPDCKYALLVTKVVGKAHGMLWYDNTLEIDKYAIFPMTLLVEEGKHATSTDKNGDGYFTPGYDVNKRVNDAWGVRDVMRTGALYSGGFQAWMAKVRHEEHRVFPPLPEDSLLRKNHLVDGEYAPDYAKYNLRPFPNADNAEPDLVHFIADKGTPDWPEVEVLDTWKQLSGWIEDESFIKSLSIAYRYDGNSGLSFSFPFFIVKGLEDPLAGGYIVHRMYFKDKDFRDFGWMLHYTPSASRWIDTYFGAGVEFDKFDLPEGSEKATDTKAYFVFETGIKFRVNMQHSPLKFLTKLTDFWGFRVGIKNLGGFDIERLVYVIEIGAGTW
ncbi:hypothetical protein ACFLT2_06160 [Acidobacteriota bacterium]